MRWPHTPAEWLPGLIVSAPVTLVLLATRSEASNVAVFAASVAVILSIPWIVPATILLAVISAPIYMWLHTQGPAPTVLDWLGGVVLVAAVVGCHLNVTLLAAWWHARSMDIAETGLRDFLYRNVHK